LVASILGIMLHPQPSSAQGAAAGDIAMLRPGDALRVRVWREPDLSGDFQVNEHGDVTLPRLGALPVSAQPVDSVRARLVREYQRFVRDATVEVTPLYRVHVTGAVRNPGLFTVDPTMSVADAVGLAGGVSPQGRTGSVVLMRNGQRVSGSLSQGSRLVELALRSGDELFVPERAWVSRNMGIVVGALSATASIVWAIRR
jgi:polysaccharide export outer membrane protein